MKNPYAIKIIAGDFSFFYIYPNVELLRIAFSRQASINKQ